MIKDIQTQLVTTSQDAGLVLLIRKAFADAKAAAEQAIRKVVICGLLLIEAKAQVKHGQFEQWLNDHCPDISWSTANRWMNTAIAAVSLAGDLPSTDARAIASFRVGEHTLREVLELPAEACPPEALEIQSRIYETVDGKSARQLMFDFKAAEPQPKIHHPRKPVNADEAIAAEDENDTEFITRVTGDLLQLTQSIALVNVHAATRTELRMAALAVAATVDEIQGDPIGYAAKLEAKPAPRRKSKSGKSNR